MKRLNNFARRNGLALLTVLVLTMWFGAQTTRAQTILQPFVECVERERDGTGAYTGNYTVNFGYLGSTTDTYDLPYPSANNFFSSMSGDATRPPTRFAPGVHRRVVAYTLPIGSSVTWFLGVSFVSAGFSTDNLCSENGANSRLITYQGKLSSGATAANGAYDLRFQLFNQPTGGDARTVPMTLEDVPVSNGIFTVQIDLGANSLPADSEGTATAVNLKLNPAILDAENSFFEIGVRAGTSTGAFTTLAPRQPLTAVPLAMRAESATVAYRAVNAENAANLGGTAANQFVRTDDGRLSNARTPTAGSADYIQNTTAQQTGNFNVSGSGTIGGTLTANATNIGGTTERLLNVQGSSPVGTWLTMNNTATGGRQWSVISTGNGNGEGAGKLLFYDLTNRTGRLLLSDAGASINGDLTVSGAITGTVSNATNATNANNAANLGGTAANQFVQTTDARLNDARTPTGGSSNYIQNTTTPQTNSNFNIGGSGTVGGSLTANTITAAGANNLLLNASGSSAIGTWLTLNNTTSGGRQWNVISTGAGNNEGAGRLLFRDSTNGAVPLTLSGGSAVINGSLTVSGAISGASKNFKIDHPLDPLNKTLTYTSVESPDMLNIYNGNALTDDKGEAVVVMPNYFEALNRDFRYQLTVIGVFAQAIVAEEISGNTFKIKTDKPNVKVSWQVAGIRRDKFAEDHRPTVEEIKLKENRGKCLYAPICQK